MMRKTQLHNKLTNYITFRTMKKKTKRADTAEKSFWSLCTNLIFDLTSH